MKKINLKIKVLPLALGLSLGLSWALLSVRSAQAEMMFEEPVFPELIVAARAMAMGNAYIAHVADASAAFYNPAGLGSVRGSQFSFSHFLVEANRDWFSIEGSSDNDGYLDHAQQGFKVDGMRKMLLLNRDKMMQQRLQFVPNYTTRYLTFGYLFSNMLRGYMGSDSSAQYEFATRRDHGPYLATNFSLGGGIFKLGASVVYLNRREAQGSVVPTNEVDVNQYYAKGKAIIFTGGAKLTMPWAWLPTLAVTWHNIGQNKFTSISGPAMHDILATIDMGFGITPLLSHESRLHLEVNYKDVRHKYASLPTKRRWLVGAEFDIFRVVYVRAGYGDGYLSGGIGLRTGHVTLDLTAYQVATKLEHNPNYADHRMALELTMNI